MGGGEELLRGLAGPAHYRAAGQSGSGRDLFVRLPVLLADLSHRGKAESAAARERADGLRARVLPAARSRGRCISARTTPIRRWASTSKMHKAMFDGVWKSGELAYSDPTTNRMKSRLPTIEDAAAYVAKTAGIKEEAFLAAAKSFGVETKMKKRRYLRDRHAIAQHTDVRRRGQVSPQCRIRRQLRQRHRAREIPRGEGNAGRQGGGSGACQARNQIVVLFVFEHLAFCGMCFEARNVLIGAQFVDCIRSHKLAPCSVTTSPPLFRNLARNRLYAAINVLGVVAGACDGAADCAVRSPRDDVRPLHPRVPAHLQSLDGLAFAGLDPSYRPRSVAAAGSPSRCRPICPRSTRSRG